MESTTDRLNGSTRPAVKKYNRNAGWVASLLVVNLGEGSDMLVSTT